MSLKRLAERGSILMGLRKNGSKFVYNGKFQLKIAHFYGSLRLNVLVLYMVVLFSHSYWRLKVLLVIRVQIIYAS